jgi:hypothetical protein
MDRLTVGEGRQLGNDLGGPGVHGGTGKRLGFDREHFQPFTSSDASAVPVRIPLFTVPANVARAEVRGLCVFGEPRAVWFRFVSWALTIGQGGAQEFLAGSTNIVSATGAPVAPVANLRDAGIRYAPMGSLVNPAPVQIDLSAGVTLGVVIVAGDIGVNPVTYMLYSRLTGTIYAS